MPTHIPPIFFQISRQYQPPELVGRIKKYLPPNWSYVSYLDVDAESFFRDNPSDEFPNILDVWKKFSGAHKTDIFRYYHLYLYGGFYMDSDAMIYHNIEDIVGDCNFVTSQSSCLARSFFQGVLGSTPGHPIIREALKDTCATDPGTMKADFHHWCKKLFIIYTCQDKNKTRLLPEIHVPSGHGDMVLNHNGDVVFKHFWKDKIIP